MAATIKFQRYTADYFNTFNPILESGEAGYETDTGKIKIGNGTARWRSLTYIGQVPSGSGEESVLLGNPVSTASGYRSVIGGGFANNAYNNYAVISGGYNQSAALYASIGGGAGNNAGGNYARIGGGTINSAGGSYATVGGGYSNSANNTYATVGGGASNGANNTYATVGGGGVNAASGTYATVGGGQANTASATHATVAGGWTNTASSFYSIVPGGIYGVADRYGMLAHSAGRFAANGDSQHAIFVLRNKTTNATPTTLFTDGGTNRLTIPNGKALFAEVHVAGISSTGAQAAHYVRKVAIKNVGGTTSLIGAVSTVGTDVEDVAGWDVAITADNTNDALIITVTGAASTTIRWTAVVDAVEIAYGT